jgi:hypothetical protein
MVFWRPDLDIAGTALLYCVAVCVLTTCPRRPDVPSFQVALRLIAPEGNSLGYRLRVLLEWMLPLPALHAAARPHRLWNK